MKSKVAFLYQARKMPNTIIPALHLKRNIFECFLFFNFPFSIQFWRLNPSNLSSDFFAERYRPESTVGPVCLPVVGEELEPEPGLWVGGRRRSGEVGSWAGPPWAPTTPSSTRGRCGREGPPIMALDLSLGLSVFFRNVQRICQYVIWDLLHLRGVR